MLPCCLWAFYCDVKVRGVIKPWNKAFYSVPATMGALLLLANCYHDFIFVIDENNVYHRGIGIYMILGLMSIYLVYAFVVSLIKAFLEPNVHRKEYLYLATFPLIPFAGVVIQMMFYGTSLIWICTVLSIFVIYVNVQNTQLSTDELTGVGNRRKLNQYLSGVMRFQNEDNRQISAIVIDIDRFKLINDTFGHDEGDKALILAANILRDCSDRGRHFLARTGGDEFAIVMHARNQSEIEALMRDIEHGIDKANADPNSKYELSFSMGYAIMGENGVHNADTLMSAADRMMYSIKSEKK